MRRPGTARARRLVGAVVVGAVVILTGVITGAGSAAGASPSTTSWSYSCVLPSGTQPVTVRATATFPDMATPRSAIQPTDVTVTATLPAAAVADLTALSAANTTATATLAVAVGQNGAAAATSWPDLVAPATALPATGDVDLAFTGTVPSATAAGTGDVTFTAGALALQFTPTTADGSATTPDQVAVTCALDSGQNAVLGTVPVPAPVLGTAPPPGGTAPAIGSSPRTGAVSRGAAANATDATDPPTDPNCPTKFPPINVNADVVGRTNLNKLDESVPLATTADFGTIALQLLGSGINPQGDLLLCWSAQMTLPTIDSTVLTFGFEPTTAPMTTTQVGNTIVETWADKGIPMATVVGQVDVRLGGTAGVVTVNGQKLNVGTHCHTETPVALNLAGIPPYSPVVGGPLEGTLTIPPFTGCGVTENLDPLLTASLSGPDNLVRIIQGVSANGSTPVPPVFK